MAKNYEEFVDTLLNNYKKYLPEDLQHIELVSTSKTKNNSIKVGCIAIRDDKSDSRLIPEFRCEDFYNSVHETLTDEEMVEEVAEIIVNLCEKTFNCNVNNPVDINRTDNIIFRLVNTKENEELLKTVPHRDFLDLSIIYCVAERNDEITGMYSVKMTNVLMQEYGLTEEELFDLAYENTKRIYPLAIEDVHDKVLRLLDNENDKELLFLLERELIPSGYLFLISNDMNTMGAMSIIYKEETLQKLAEQFDSDLYVFPSSIHEILVSAVNLYPDSDSTAKDLKEMVCNINISSLLPEEVLSNNIYYYNKDKKELTVIED